MAGRPEEEIPLLERTDDRNDGDDTSMQGPGGTPGTSVEQIPPNRITTINRQPERGTRTLQTSFIENPPPGKRVLDSDSLNIEVLQTKP